MSSLWCAGRTSVSLGLLASMLLLSSACSSTVGTQVEWRRPGMPPLARVRSPIVYLTPHSQRYRIAVLNFRDQTGRADLVKESIADMLTTELYASKRFNLYDRGDVRRQVVRNAGSDPTTSNGTNRGSGNDNGGGPSGSSRISQGITSQDIVTVDASLSEQFQRIGWAVDGILTGYVTAISFDDASKGSFSTDFRIVNPDTQLVVYSDSAVVRFSTNAKLDSITLERADVRRMADKIKASFIDLASLGRQELVVTDVVQDQVGAKIVLNAGSAENKVKQGFAGFVVERDERTKVVRYIAKFVVVNVFPEAAVGVIVPHCNAMYGGCGGSRGDGSNWIQPQDQVGNIRVGAAVLMK